MREKRKKEIVKRYENLPIEVLEIAEVDPSRFPMNINAGDTVHLQYDGPDGELITVAKHEIQESFVIDEAVVFKFKDTERHKIGYGGYFAQRKHK